MKNHSFFAQKDQHIPKFVPPDLEVLPNELLIEILLFIPESELLNEIRKVSSLWHNIIFSIQFANGYMDHHGSPLKRFYDSSLEKFNGSARKYLDVLTGREIGDNTEISFKKSWKNLLEANENPVFNSTIAKMGFMQLHSIEGKNDGTTTSLKLSFQQAIRGSVPLLMQQVEAAEEFLTQLEEANTDASIPTPVLEALPSNEIKSQLRILKIKIAAFDLIYSVETNKPEVKKAALICLKALDRILKYMPSASFATPNNRQLNELTELFKPGSFQDDEYQNRLKAYNKKFGYRRKDKIACQSGLNFGLIGTSYLTLLSLTSVVGLSSQFNQSAKGLNGIAPLVLLIVMCSILSVGSSIGALIFYCRAFRYCLSGLRSRNRFFDPNDSYPIELYENSMTGKMRAAITELTKYLGILFDSVAKSETVTEEAVTETSPLLQYTR